MNHKTVAAMDLLVPGFGEIVGGSQREERYDLLLKRMQELNMPEEGYWWYLDTRRYSSNKHAGFGLGFEQSDYVPNRYHQHSRCDSLPRGQ